MTALYLFALTDILFALGGMINGAPLPLPPVAAIQAYTLKCDPARPLFR
jgi:hypothetical protein